MIKFILTIAVISFFLASTAGSMQIAYAAHSPIDDFENGLVDEVVNSGDPGPKTTNEDGLLGVIGADRDTSLSHFSGPFDSKLRINDASIFGALTYSADSDTKSTFFLLYDSSGTGLNEDFGLTTAIIFDYQSSDGGTDVKVTLTSDADGSDAGPTTVSKTRTSVASNTPYNLIFPMTDFPGLELADIDSIKIDFTPKGNSIDFRLNSITTEHGIPPSEIDDIPSFFVGGGKVILEEGAKPKDTVFLTHGYELHCNEESGPNNLQINWGTGPAKKHADRFHLEQLTMAICLDDETQNEPPKSPHPGPTTDIYIGEGTGRYNGECGATATWTFSDNGEPGKSDQIISLVIKVGDDIKLNINPSLAGVLAENLSEQEDGLYLQTGNHQFVPHKSGNHGPTKTNPCPAI